MGGATLGRVVLSSIAKQAEQTRGRNQEAAPLRGLCISSYLQVPAIFECLLWLLSVVSDSGYSCQITIPPQVDFGRRVSQQL